jgi:hypothetical protein
MLLVAVLLLLLLLPPRLLQHRSLNFSLPCSSMAVMLLHRAETGLASTAAGVEQTLPVVPHLLVPSQRLAAEPSRLLRHSICTAAAVHPMNSRCLILSNCQPQLPL